MEFGLRDRPKGGGFCFWNLGQEIVQREEFFGVPPSFGNLKDEVFLRFFFWLLLLLLCTLAKYCPLNYFFHSARCWTD